MDEHPIQGLMKTAMESLKDMVDVNTVVGDPVESPDGSVIVPVSRVTFGFTAGGGEYGAGAETGLRPFAGGSGAGVSVQPVGFLVVGQGTVRMLPVSGGAVYDRIIDAAPGLLAQLKSLFNCQGNAGAQAQQVTAAAATTPAQPPRPPGTY